MATWKNRRTKIYGATLFVAIFYFTIPSFSWTITSDFEQGQEGLGAYGVSGFHGAGSRTLYSTERASSGQMSAKMKWVKGSTGWAECHGRYTYPEPLREGDEIWLRGYFYFQSPWSWRCAPRVKILRVHVRGMKGEHKGYLSVLASNGGIITLSNEVDSYEPTLGVYFNLDRWQCVEMYIKFSSTKPIFRIWKDGILIAEDKRHRTLRISEDLADFSYIMTYWNGGVSQDQIQFVDDFKITNEKPSNYDKHGNPMIGCSP